MTRIIRECGYWWKDLACFFNTAKQDEGRYAFLKFLDHDTVKKLHGTGARMTRTNCGSLVERYWQINMAPSTRMTCEKVFNNEDTSGHDRCHRTLRPIRL